jgi:hypothetical protein
MNRELRMNDEPCSFEYNVAYDEQAGGILTK